MAQVKLTDKELKALRGILQSEFHDGAKGDERIGIPVWSWSCNPFSSARTFGGVVASLIKKELIEQSGEGDDACLSLTRAGYDAATLPRSE